MQGHGRELLWKHRRELMRKRGCEPAQKHGREGMERGKRQAMGTIGEDEAERGTDRTTHPQGAGGAGTAVGTDAAGHARSAGGASVRFTTAGALRVERSREPLDYRDAIDDAVGAIDAARGVVLSSNYEVPGRYTRWDVAFIDPPLVLEARGRHVVLTALNARGRVPLDALRPVLRALPEAVIEAEEADALALRVAEPGRVRSEEERSRAPSVFTVLRAIREAFAAPDDPMLGLYGAFGYDLVHQFEPIETRLARDPDQRDLVLYLPDALIVVDHHNAEAWRSLYEFSHAEDSTRGLSREGERFAYEPAAHEPPRGDHEPGEYAALVRRAKPHFERGDLFEVVPGQMFTARAAAPPSAIARRLRAANPSPYSFAINLGPAAPSRSCEYLVGASPEMFVRVTGRRVETCPISGTIRRGRDAIEDAANVLELLNSKKDESELTMCSDVDRNDKSRVCEPGSVRIIGRRQIEMYSRLIHTVDHIEGRLLPGRDALDAFLSHAWAVTVTGAPKLWAMRFIEENERSPRRWYGGAVGMIGFDGDMNTGLTLRTIRIEDGIAEVRAGATLLYDSDPEAEEAETELKASAMLAAIREAGRPNDAAASQDAARVGEGMRVLLVDHEDSFVHTLAAYVRRTGAEVTTIRTPVPPEAFDEIDPDLVLLSPGPGTPADFDCAGTIGAAEERDLPLFGVCLGLQALVEAHGGTLERLGVPVHGKPSRIRLDGNGGGAIFSGLEDGVTVGRYHSIAAREDALPEGYRVTARTDDGTVMAIEHRDRPIAAVQFHPESLMSLGAEAGQRMIENALVHLVRPREGAAVARRAEAG